MPNQEPLILDLNDYRGRRIIFTKKKLEEKKSDHPELGLVEFIRAIKSALKEPEEVWPDYYERREKHCYYGKYIDGVYAKVVVYVRVERGEPCRVVSAYAIDYVKERKYKDLTKIV
jgi:hypothetical protein